MRKYRRYVAHEKLKKAGYVRVNKDNPSYFSKHWREFV